MAKKKNKTERYSDPDYDAYVEQLNQEERREYEEMVREEERAAQKKQKKAKKEKKSKNADDVYALQGASDAAAGSDVQEEIRRRASRRLTSLDALRGINMLCILGLAYLISCICNLHIEDFRVLGDGAVRAATAFRQCWIGPSPETIAKHMDHVRWNGVLHHDTIFPLFLFLAGVSFPFSYRKQRANGRPMWRVILKILWRGFALVLLGIVYSNKVNFDFAHLRYMGVLQHIGLAWMFAALIYLVLANHKKTMIGVSAFILVSYWLVVALVPAPDVAPKEAFTGAAFASRAKDLFKVQTPYGLAAQEQGADAADADGSVEIAATESADAAGADATDAKPAKRAFRFVPVCEDNVLPDFDDPDYPEIGTVAHNLLPEGCVVNYIDRKLVPGKLYHQPTKWEGEECKRSEIKKYDPKLFRDLRDPEGLASTWPAIVTALLGMLFGGVLCREDEVCSKARKCLTLIIGGVILLAIGFAWHLVFPINKNLWNSSFVCFVGGYSAIVLALFYFFIDVCRLRWLGFPFAVVGMNSITIFVAKRVIVFTSMRDFFFKDAIDRFVPTTRTIVVDGAEKVLETGAFSEIATVIAGLIVTWCFVYWLYRHRIFMRV